MKLLKTITDDDISGVKFRKLDEYKERTAGRAVLFNEMGEIALLNVQKEKYHKLPGGGVEAGEEIDEALKREFKEETGCKIEIEAELGVVEEYRNEFKLHQLSKCYFARVIERKEPNFTKREKDRKFSLMFVPIEEAIKLMELDKPDSYEGKYVVLRDLVLLKEALRIITE